MIKKIQTSGLADGMPFVHLLAKIANAQGADGVFVLRGATGIALSYVDIADDSMHGIELTHPSEMVVLIRFPGGDGRPAGIENL